MNALAHLALFRRRCFLVAFCLLPLLGCSLTKSRTVWRPPALALPTVATGNSSLAAAEQSYLAAVELESDDNSECVDHYLNAAGRSWTALEFELASAGRSSDRTSSLYHSSLAKLIATAQRFGRWDPCRGLVASTSCPATIVPSRLHGFKWQADQFQYLDLVGDYSSPNLVHAFQDHGLGVPLVVTRHVSNPQPFMKNEQSFAATAVLRYQAVSDSYELAFYDPLREANVTVANCPVPLARDITAPFAYVSRADNRTWLDNFLRPGAEGSGDGLFMIEPYQPGKIPVLFVHGLLSDPSTWMDLVNELRNDAVLSAKYQWWGFQYSTGEPFLTSAAVLRKQLRELRSVYDPHQQDPSFSRMVLIGHSMGGLVAKLQVTHSEGRLWEAAFRMPLDRVRTTAAARQQLQEAFFFEPSCDINRVIYIATPHAGSSWARRPIGRLGAAIVEVSPETKMRHEQLEVDNPGIYQEELVKRFPTSVDLLEPTDPLLIVTGELKYSPRVKLHSVVGTGEPMWNGDPADGVVPVTSARLQGVCSEIFVDAKHEYLHNAPATIVEVARILREHQ